MATAIDRHEPPGDWDREISMGECTSPAWRHIQSEHAPAPLQGTGMEDFEDDRPGADP
jgi:hypothetical protein